VIGVAALAIDCAGLGIQGGRGLNGALPMRLISSSEFLRAILIGGAIGALAASAISLTIEGSRAGTTDIVAGAWIGFGLACAFTMIRNATSTHDDFTDRNH
jgi:hypothetical protein